MASAFLNATVERCIDECLQCMRWCEMCVEECLTTDPAKMAECIRLCHECPSPCGSCVTLLAGQSRYAHQQCGVCADICNACAAECENFSDLDTMRKCAEACRRCARTCGEIASGGPIRRAA